VAGKSAGTSSGFDYATIKYSNSGVPVWTNRYGGPGNSTDEAVALAVDSTGNIFVTGDSVGTASGADYLTIKYSPSGIPLWTNRYTSSGARTDIASGVAVDLSGNVFVTGYSPGVSGSDYVTIAYSNAGVPFWTNRCSAVSKPVGIAVDKYGNVLVTGPVTVKYYSSLQPFLTVQSYNSRAVLTWTNSMFNLQSASSPEGTFVTIPGASSPWTNSPGPQGFFRLSSPY
jgi:hypothetical protein